MPDHMETNWVEYKDRSLEITRKTAPKFDEWALLMATLNTMNESGSFWRGDLYLQGEIWYGDDQASSIFEPENWQLKTWQNNAGVCQRVPASRRREALSFSHHAEVAYLEPEQFKDPPRPTIKELQVYYLEIAIANKFSVRQLRDKIKEDKGIKPKIKSLFERLNDIIEKLIEWREEAEGDVYDLMGTAIESLADAAEIQRDIEDG